MTAVSAFLALGLLPAPASAIGDIQEAIDDALRDLPKSLNGVDSKVVTVAVYPLKTDDETAGDSGVIQDKIVKVLLDTTRFKVIDRESLELLLKEQALSLTGLTDNRAEMMRVGKLIEADAFMFGNASVTGEKLTLTLKLVEVATSAIVWQEVFTGESRTRGRFAIGLVWAMSNIKGVADFSYDGRPDGQPVNIVAPDIAYDYTQLGSGISIAYRQPLRYSRLWGFGADLTGLLTHISGDSEMDSVGVDQVSGRTTTTHTSLGFHIYLSAGAMVFMRGKALFKGAVDRLNPFVGLEAGMQKTLMNHSEIRSADTKSYIDDPVASMGAVFARIGAEMLFTRHLTGDIEFAVPVWTRANVVEQEITVTVDESTGPYVRFALRYVL